MTTDQPSKRFRWPLLNVALALAIGVSGCGSPSDTVTGLVTAVEGTLTDIEFFTVLADGESWDFRTIEGHTYDFPLDHLREHLRAGEPVEVQWEDRDGVLYAVAVSDA